MNVALTSNTCDQVTFRVATGEDLFHAFLLVAKTYIREGILSTPSENDFDGYMQLFNQFFDKASHKTTFVAIIDQRVVGTISLYVGGPFPIEEKFACELFNLRKEGLPLTYIGLFAVEKEYREHSLGNELMKLVKSLFRNHGRTNTLCVVNRHHVRAHQREGFAEIAEAKSPLTGLSESAKAVLLLRRQHADGTFVKVR